MKSESEIQDKLQTSARYAECQLMRNNSGALKRPDGTPVRFGLGNISKEHNDRIKSSDLIGFTKITITPDMVGQTVAIFTAVECKDEVWKETKKFDAREIAQSNFIEWVKANGGLAGFANNIDMLKKILRK